MKTAQTQDYRSMTRKELYALSRDRGIEGTAQLTKDELVHVLEREDVGPDAVDLLIEHHNEIRRLFDEITALEGSTSQRKRDLVQELVTVLVKHAEVEEQVFYPAVRAELDDQEDEVEESLEEHHVAELLLSELDGMKLDAARFDAKVAVLRQNVLHHLQDEEEGMFVRVIEGMTDARRRELGAAMVGVWRIAPTRPHPHSPDTPPGNLLVALPTTVIDLTVGVVRGVGRGIGHGVGRLVGRG